MTRTRPRRRFLVAAIAVTGAAALALSGCASGGGASSSDDGSGSSGPVKGGNLTVRIAQDPGSLDPVRSDNASGGYIDNEIYEGLVTVNKNYEATPQLAKKIDKSEDGKTYTFTLRDGLKFSDGSPVTAKDAVASIKYWVENNGYASSLKDALDEITAPDDTTVVVKLKEPFNVPALMSRGAYVTKASIADGAPETGFTKKQIIGTGPYKLKTWDAGNKIVLTRNDDYTAPKGESSGYAGPRHAYLDTITYKVVKDADAALNGLKTGEWQVIEGDNDQYSTVKADSNLKIGVEGGGNINHVAFNHHPESIMSKAKARDGMNLIIDQKAIRAATGVPELVKPSYGAFAGVDDKEMHSDAGKAKWQKYNPKKGKKMLEEAGLKPGQKLRMITTGEFPQFKQAAVLIQQDLKKVGIDSTIGTYDFATLIAKEKNPSDWDMLLLMDDINPPVPDYTDNVKDLGAAGYDSPELGKLMKEYNKAQTPEEAHDAVDKIQALTSKNLPTITLTAAKSYMAYSKDLKGFDGWGFEFANAWLEK